MLKEAESESVCERERKRRERERYKKVFETPNSKQLLKIVHK